MFFANFDHIYPHHDIHGCKATDLSVDLAPSDRNLKHPTSRQNFGDGPGQTPKLILTLCLNHCWRVWVLANWQHSWLRWYWPFCVLLVNILSFVNDIVCISFSTCSKRIDMYCRQWRDNIPRIGSNDFSRWWINFTSQNPLPVCFACKNSPRVFCF